MMRKFVENSLGIIFGMAILTMIMLCVITPDKTNNGEYTNLWKYWTNNQYFYDNFNN